MGITLISVVVPTTFVLPKKPIYDKFVDGWQGAAAIYGAEYQTSTFPGLKNSTSMTHHVLCVTLEHGAHK